jgi:hypothetical protein
MEPALRPAINLGFFLEIHVMNLQRPLRLPLLTPCRGQCAAACAMTCPDFP